ncbi:MAG: hypothetical protein BLM47_07800 [Candidatus Reconcilbacillus cellulovorans]|uniref:Uncharacterized protein n=1 Tax=Candidatus Reconcilbacillus cellulovorans TaxID=1906605 RepID=A0A2A6E0A7_9BACL|nr:MAG: hypothetical protein BLM47_07800 [Candidatus Reconcilbacillus cellulovorans]
MRDVEIDGEFITLGQLLKLTRCVPTGGAVKAFLRERSVLVNAVREERRGRKLRPGDKVEVPGVGTFRIVGGGGASDAPGAPET